MRRFTTSGHELQKMLGALLTIFIEASQSNLMIPNFGLSNLANMDETSYFSLTDSNNKFKINSKFF